MPTKVSSKMTSKSSRDVKPVPRSLKKSEAGLEVKATSTASKVGAAEAQGIQFCFLFCLEELV